MNSNQKLLVITYYWPPSGGAGVQRWLKMTKYLAQLGIEIHVLTVDPAKASYLQIDETLQEDVPSSIKVHYSNSFEPIRLFTQLVGKSSIPNAGYSNVDETNWKQKLLSKVRSRIFIPDPRIGWKKYAYKKALSIIEKENIQNVVTTSPPHSVQLIGRDLKRKLKDKVKWIVDLRDPWTDIYYYHLLNHSRRSHQKNLKLEREILNLSDQIITVGEGFKASFLSKTNRISSEKFEIITNAYDPDDFKMDTPINPDETVFLVAYIGTISEKYNPDVFFEALGQLVKDFPEAPIRFKATGVIDLKLQEKIVSQMGEKASFHAPVSHEMAVQQMLKSDVLLLVTQGKEGTIPGKTFEYLASKRRIVCIGKGDSAKIIERCKAGAAFERNEKTKIYEYLKSALLEFQEGKSFQSDTDEVENLSWQHNAEKLVNLLE